MNQKTDAEFTRMEDMTSIFDCAEYLRHSYPMYIDTWDYEFKRPNPVAYSFAYTPKGNVSKFWCVLEFHRTEPTDDAIRNWMENRPKLRKGYRWSKPYWYTSPRRLIPPCKVNGKEVTWN